MPVAVRAYSDINIYFGDSHSYILPDADFRPPLE
jgi:hypothetical protein